MLDSKVTMTIKALLVRNDVFESCVNMMIFQPKKGVGTAYLRSLGHYKIKHSVLQQNLSAYYIFEVVCKI